ncbi:hypothetical protein PSTT_11705, partial [Puccinia striiformis]
MQSFLLFPLLLIRLSSALPLLSGASGGTHIGKTAFELPNSPVASTQASKHGEDLGTIIHQTANTVLDELISNARSDREDYKTPFYLGQIREVYPLRHSEACTQMENFHSKLIAIEDTRTNCTGRLTNHLEPIGGVNPNDFLTVLAMSLHPKFDELIRELIDTGRMAQDLKDEKALVLHLHSKLDPLVKKINLKWFPIMQDLMHLNRDIRFFILELDQKLDLVLAALSNERKITSRIAIMFEKVISASYDNVSRFISAFDRPELFDGSSLSSTLPAMLFQHKLNRMSASPV